MINVRNNTIALLAILSLIFGGLQLAIASEVTGTLSSDGKAQTQPGTVLSETNSDGASGPITAQNGGQIQGFVTGGKEDSAALALASPSSWDTTTWVVLLSALILAVSAYFFWRRQVV